MPQRVDVETLKLQHECLTYGRVDYIGTEPLRPVPLFQRHDLNRDPTYRALASEMGRRDIQIAKGLVLYGWDSNADVYKHLWCSNGKPVPKNKRAVVRNAKNDMNRSVRGMYEYLLGIYEREQDQLKAELMEAIEGLPQPVVTDEPITLEEFCKFSEWVFRNPEASISERMAAGKSALKYRMGEQEPEDEDDSPHAVAAAALKEALGVSNGKATVHD